MGRMNGLTMVGVILVVIGVLGLAIPVFTTQKTTEVARVGDVSLQNTEDTSHRIPQMLSGGALALGIVLVGAGLVRKR